MTARPVGRRRWLKGAARAALGAGLPALAAAAPLRFKCAHNILSTHPTSRRLLEAAERLRQESGGEIAIDVFPDSQLGSETDLLGQLRSGAIDFLPLSGLTLQTLVPAAGINGLPFVFDGYPAVWAAMDGEVGAQVRGAVEGARLHALERMFDNGFRHVTTRVRPIETPADFAGLRIRVPVSPLRTAMFKALGAQPTTLNFAELYMALQTRLVDAQENPLAIVDLGKFHEVQRFCSLTRHVWDGHWLLVNGARWRGLPVDARALLERRFDDAALGQREDFRRVDDESRPRLDAAGLVFNSPPLPPFRRALERADFYGEWRRRFGPAAMQALERYCGPVG